MDGRGEQASSYGHLVPGGSYTVATPFTAYDDVQHPAGERWTFVRYTYLPYEDRLTVYLSASDGRGAAIRMQNRLETPGAILDDFERYLAPDA